MTLRRLRTRRHLLRDIGLAGAAGALGWLPRTDGRWRPYDAEDTLRFYALRLHEAGLIRSNPRTVIAQGADWRFFRDLRRELKG